MTSHVMLDGSHKGNTWDWLKIISWSMTDEELRRWITLGHTSLISDGFSKVIWSTRGHAPFLGDIFFWNDPTLGHSHFRVRFYWRYNHSTRYSALRHIPLIDGWFLRWWFILRHGCFRDCTCWDIVLSLAMDFDLSWSIDTSDGLY